MKKIIVMFLILNMIVTSAFAISDYDKGYLDGYEACKNGERNEVQTQLDEAASTASAMGVWEKKYFLDSFGDKTKNSYLSIIIYDNATFSNSATTNSKLSSIFIVDKYGVSLLLYEYGSHLVKGSYDNKINYSISIKCDEQTYYDKATNSSDRLSFNDSLNFIELLKKEKPITIRIKEISKYSSSTYLIRNIDTTGFNYAYKVLFHL